MLYQGDSIIAIEEFGEVVDLIRQATIDSVEACRDIVLSFDKDLYSEYLIKEYGDIEIGRNVMLLETIEVAKKTIFQNVLESYNNYLREGVDIKSSLKKIVSYNEANIKRANHDIVATTIVVTATVILLPGIAPIVIGISIPKYGLDILAKKGNLKQMAEIKQFIEEYDSIRPEFFELTDTLRTDYHRTNKKIKELKERALAGENVIEDVMSLLDLETIGLPNKKSLDEKKEYKKNK